MCTLRFSNLLTFRPSYPLNVRAGIRTWLNGLAQSPRRAPGAVRKTGTASHFLRCQNGTNGPFRQSLPYTDPPAVPQGDTRLPGPGGFGSHSIPEA